MLAVLLLSPWLLVLCFLYWWYPRDRPHSGTRRIFDVAMMVLSLVATAAGAWFAQINRQPALTDALGHRSGDIWPQVLAAVYAYSAFTLVMLVAIVLRHFLWRRRA